MHMMRIFTGLITYYRSCVDGYATRAARLHDLTRKGTDFIWTDEHQKAFDFLRDTLSKQLKLPHAIRVGILILDIDACDVAA